MKEHKKLFSFEKPEENAGFLLWQVSMHWQRKMKQALAPLDLTHTQFVLLAALAWLSQSEEEVYQIDIANHAKVDKMMTSKVIKSLVQKKIITAKDSQVDSRAKYLTFTNEGLTLFEQALRTVEQVDRQFFADLGSKAVSFRQMMQKLMES